MRIAINGMGRIGRLLCRRLINHPTLELVAVNDIINPENIAYLLNYDSIYGANKPKLTLENGNLAASSGGGRAIKVFRQGEPSKLPWKSMDIDVALECSGKFTDISGAAQHLEAGARKVMLSTTGSSRIPLLIYGFNHHTLTPEMSVIAAGGCMTNCTTHILKILQELDIQSAMLHMVHSYTSRQELVDTSNAQFRRGRAAADSIIPVDIDLALSLERLFPALQHKIGATSTRVPVANGALADFTVTVRQATAREQVNDLLRTNISRSYEGIVEYTEDQIVSSDIRGNSHSAIIDGSLTMAVGNQVKVFAWFDNEFGYTSRMIDLLEGWKGQ